MFPQHIIRGMFPLWFGVCVSSSKLKKRNYTIAVFPLLFVSVLFLMMSSIQTKWLQNLFSIKLFMITGIQVPPPFYLWKTQRVSQLNFILFYFEWSACILWPKHLMQSTFGYLNSLTCLTRPCLSASGGKLTYFRKAAA